MAKEIEVWVRDEKGKPVEGARVDLDYHTIICTYSEYELTEDEVEVGGYDPKSLYGDAGNAVTNEDGYCKISTKKNWDFRVRVAKREWLNKDSKQDWTEFQSAEERPLYFTIYRFWILTTIRVRDRRGNAIKDARVDIDFSELSGRWYDWEDFAEEDVIKGKLEKGRFWDDPYNIIVNEEGVAQFFLWKRGTRKIEDWSRNLPNWVRFRAGAKGWLNKDGEEDWSEFKEHEIKIDDTGIELELTLYSMTVEFDTHVLDQCGRVIPLARVDIDANYHWDPRWYEFTGFTEEDISIGSLDRAELYDDAYNVRSNDYGHAKFRLPKIVDDKRVEYYGLRAAHPDYENMAEEWDWGDRKTFKITPEVEYITQKFALNKPCDLADPCTWSKCVPEIPWWIYVVSGVAVVGGAIAGSYAFWKKMAERIF